MKDRKKLVIPALIRVDTLNSIYRFTLAKTEEVGDIHDFYEIVFVEEGEFPILVDGIPYVIPEGSLFVYAPNAYHVADTAHPGRVVVDIVSFDCASPALRCLDNRLITPTERERELLLSFFREAQGELLNAAPRGVLPREGISPLTLQLLGNRLEAVLLLLCNGRDEGVHTGGGRRAYKKERFLALGEHLRGDLAAHHTLASMAEACACSISTVKALCREFCGTGPNDYLITLRIERARALIREGSMNFTEIAEATGFGSLHYFSRVFRARTGQTPTQYAAMVIR